MTDRLDRIEKGLEGFFRAMEEARKRQDRMDEQLNRLTEKQDRTDEQLNKLREFQEIQIRELKNLMDKVERRLDEVGRQLGDLGIVQGEIGEDLFYRNLKSMFRKRDILFRDIKRNLKRKGRGEYDIVAINGRQVLVVEVKNKLTRRNIDRFVDKKLPIFKELFPEYGDRDLLGAVGALVVKDDVGRYAEKRGLFVLTQTDEGGAAIINKEKFKPKVFG